VGLATFIIVFLFSLIGISKNPTTPFDEAAHFDYIVKLSKGHLPKVNERYSQTTLEWMACETQKPDGWSYLEPCGSEKFSPKLAPFWGQSTATGYAPNYYVLTAIPYKICSLTTEQSPINCARIANSIWLALAASISVLVMSLLGLSPILASIVSIGFYTFPSVLLQGITVNSDAAAFTTSILFILLAMKLSSKKMTNFSALLLYSIFVFTLIPIKQTSLPMAAFGLLLLWQWKFRQSNLKRFSSGGVPLIALLASLVATFAWQAAQVTWRGIAYKDNMTEWLASVSAGLSDSMNLALVSGLSPFSLVTWGPLVGTITGTIAGVIALLSWVTLLGPKSIHTNDDSSGTNFQINDQAAFVGFMLAVFSPMTLAYMAWLISGSAAVQPRYYMATAITLGCIGIASTSSIYLRILGTSVLGVSTYLSLSMLIAI
jgi:hypothetical protein